MAALNNSASKHTLERVILDGTCNFYENESCELLAQFIAQAPKL